jgi:hypothetical protein
MSPPLWLALSATAFYLIGPALGRDFPNFLLLPPIWSDRLNALVNGGGETSVAWFALAAGALHVLLFPQLTEPGMRRSDAWPLWMLGLLGGAALVLALLNHPALAGHLGTATLRNLSIPLIAVLLSALAFGSANRPVGRMILIPALALTFGAMIMMKMGKAPIFIAGSVILLHVIVSGTSARYLAILAACAFGALLVSVTAIGLLRYGPSADSSMLWSAVPSKLVHRQVETLYCLDNVTISVGRDGAQGRIGDLFVGVIPRVLWPEKPSLSNGSDYAVAYCGYSVAGITASSGNVHSASISLLGEPVLRTASPAQGVAICIILVALLGGMALLAPRLGDAGLIAFAALFPWLVDFDQGFALFLALGLKNLLIVLPVAYVLVWTQRRLARVGPAESSQKP